MIIGRAIAELNLPDGVGAVNGVKDKMDHKKRIQMDNKYWNVVAELKQERETSKNLAYALEELLLDSQHANHNCGEDCPVRVAEKALNEYKKARQ